MTMTITATAHLTLVADPAPGTEPTRFERTPRYTIEIEAQSSYAILRTSGDLDMNALAELTDALDQLIADGADIVMDMSTVTFMYSGIANAVISAAAATEGKVQIFAPTRPVQMILDVLGAADLLIDRLPEAHSIAEIPTRNGSHPASPGGDTSFLQMFVEAATQRDRRR